MGDKKTGWYFALFLALIFAISLFYVYKFNSENIIPIIQNSMYFAPLLYILFVAIQVLIFPIPGQFAGLIGGYFFGFLWGTVYSLIGVLIGSLLAFYISRKLGRPFIEKLSKKGKIKKLENLIKGKEETIFFLILLIPFMPDDIICFIAGLTKIKAYRFAILTLLGRLPGFFFLNLAGAGMSSGREEFFILLALVILISIILFFSRNFLENKIISIIKRFKKRKKRKYS